MKNELIILIGVPGSGKSTYANELLKQKQNLVKISRDDFRFMLRNKWYVEEEVEHLISSIADTSVFAALKKGFDVVLDNSHCNAKTLKETIDKFGKHARIILKVIGAELSIKQIKAQNLNRTKAVPEGVIDRMYQGFTHIIKNKKVFQDQIHQLQCEQVLGEGYTPKQDATLPKAIIVDIDGTVAHMNGKRGPFEWHNVDKDDPDNAILNIVRALSIDYHIVFMSGRDASCRQLTLDWLYIYFGHKDIELYMREEGDMRKDSIVKTELFYKHIHPKYYVEAVLDDRKQVVDMWRNELGLKCLQVQEGNF